MPHTELTFKKELEHLINKYSWDVETNIPDYILANHIHGIMISLRETQRASHKWHTDASSYQGGN